MATLESIQCKGCGSPLDRDTLKECPYCGSANFIKSEVNPLKMTSVMAQKYVSFFKNKSKENPKDTNSLFAMGLLYLGLKNYELAQRNFKEAIDLSPMEADVYYYYALSLVDGKSLKSLESKDIKRIEEYLNSAIGMEVKCKYLAFLMAVKQEYYLANGLKLKGDSPAELFEQAKNYSPDELDEIQMHILLRDQDTIDCMNELSGVLPEENNENDEDEDVEEDNSDNEEEVEEEEEEEEEEYVDLSAKERQQYFDYRFEPLKPGRNQHNPLPTFPIFRKLLNLIIILAVTFVLFIIFNLAGWGFTSNEVSLNKFVIADSARNIRDINGVKLTKKERLKAYNKMLNDSIEQVKKDSIFNETSIFTISRIKDDKKHFLAIKKDKMSFLWITLLFLPLGIWTTRTIIEFTKIGKNRRIIKDNYKYALEMYNSKPTDGQMKMYVMNFLSQIVDIELEYYKKDEDDLKGKILFLNNYFKYKNASENYENSGIEYTVALLEDTHVTVLKSDWLIYKESPEKGEAHTVFYSDISNVRLKENSLIFGDIEIEIPDECVFEYQCDDTDDELTFSNDRTSDPRVFKAALDKLVNSHKNK